LFPNYLCPKNQMGGQQSKKVESKSNSQTTTSKSPNLKAQDRTPSAVFFQKRSQHQKSAGHEDLIKVLQNDTHFDKVETSKLYEVFMSLSKGGTTPLDKNQFKKGLAMLSTVGLKTGLDSTPFVDRLFVLLDTDNSGTIDLREFITGLSCLCKGTPEEKIRVTFKAYDLDNSGFIDQNELTIMFKNAWISGFRMLSAAHPEESGTLSPSELDTFSTEIATAFASQAFDVLDANHDGKISFEEFVTFALSDPKITATLNGFKQDVSLTFG